MGKLLAEPKSGCVALPEYLGTPWEGVFRVRLMGWWNWFEVFQKGMGHFEVCSGRQGHDPAGGSPVVPIARFRHVAIPQFLRVTLGPLRGVNGPAALWT